MNRAERELQRKAELGQKALVEANDILARLSLLTPETSPMGRVLAYMLAIDTEYESIEGLQTMAEDLFRRMKKHGKIGPDAMGGLPQ